jgi:hypothetical protein
MTARASMPEGATAAGVLPDHELRAANADGWITAPVPLGDEQFQPASLDLRLGPIAYQLRASFLPFRESVQDRLDGDGDLVISPGTVAVAPNLSLIAYLPTDFFADRIEVCNSVNSRVP